MPFRERGVDTSTVGEAARFSFSPRIPISPWASLEDQINHSDARSYGRLLAVWTGCLMAVALLAVWLFGLQSLAARPAAADALPSAAPVSSESTAPSASLQPTAAQVPQLGKASGPEVGGVDPGEAGSIASGPESDDDRAHDPIRITFASGSHELPAKAVGQLDQVIGYIDEGTRLIIEGHTDSLGDPSENQHLSERRAQSVVDYLVTAGVSPDLLTAVGYGETRPVADNETAAGRAANRRVELVIER